VNDVQRDVLKVVGGNVRRIRLERGLSQEAFADLIGIHRTDMGGIEPGERNLTLRSLDRIAERLDVPLHELVRPSED